MKPGPDRDLRIFLWFVVFAIVLVATTLLLSDKAMAARRQQSVPNWAQIAAFYAGRPIKLSEDTRGPLSATTGVPMSGEVRLGKGLLKGLEDFFEQWNIAKHSKGQARKDALQRAIVYGVNPLSVLVHESIHNREFSAPDPNNPYFTPYLESNQRGPLGFYGAGNEPQAQALGAELIPDLMQRFFGVKIGSPLSKRFERAAKSRGEYQGAYRVGAANG